MTMPEFVALVAECRKWQRRWFDSDKSSATLRECKVLEKRVDLAIATIQSDGSQGTLFGEG